MSEAIYTQNFTQSMSLHHAELVAQERIEPLSHDELVCLNLLEILEESHEDLDKGMKDALIMMLIEHGIDLEELQ